MAKKRSILFLLIFSLIFSIISLRATEVKALSIPGVVVTPNVIGVAADYKITFTINSNMLQGGVFTILFPTGTGIPCSSCNPYILAANLKVNGVSCMQNGVGDTVARKLNIYSPIPINAGSQVVLFISRGARITNPTAEGAYTLQVSTNVEPGFVTSQSYTLGKSEVSTPKVNLSSNIVSGKAAYIISFNAGPMSPLQQGTDSVSIVFPAGTYVPPAIKGSSIVVNGVPVNRDLISPNDNTVNIPLPVDILPTANVVVQFTLDAGITNPSSAGQKTLLVYTSQDSTQVHSLPYNIQDISMLTTQVIATPLSPDGENGWYVSIPIIAFIPRGSVDSMPVVYYKIDDQGNYTTYSTPFTMPVGIHTLYYYTVNTAYGETEQVQSKKFKINPAPPKLDITQPQGDIQISTTDYLVKGSVSDLSNISTLTLNGNPVQVVDSSFEVDVKLQEGTNTLNFVCVDDAGNKTSVNLNITVSSVVPKISISSPLAMSQIQEDSINVQGSVDIPSNVTINGDTVTLNSDGSFSYPFSLVDATSGFVLIKIVATSTESGLSANKTITLIYNPKPKALEVKLTIGSTTAVIDPGSATLNSTTTLDSAPYVDPNTNRTLVPLRFIAETFGATVNWDEGSKTVTITLNHKEIKLQIGNSTAYINGEEETLDQPPVIINSRTMVPLRFIAEAFGATVDWDDTTQTILITYPLS